MSTIRLNEGDRTFLYGLAKERITCPDEEKADAIAYAKAAPLVRHLVEDRYPTKDMKLLLKYTVARHDDCIRLQLAAGGVVEFNFRMPDKGPLVPNGYGCSNRMYIAGQEETDAISASLTAKSTCEKARSQKLADYKALIWASQTLEQIEGVWPLAGEVLRPRKGRALPVVLSDEVIARIKADLPSLKKAA
jgi:hypothetical protein